MTVPARPGISVQTFRRLGSAGFLSFSLGSPDFPRKGSGTPDGSKLWRKEAETTSPLKGQAWNWQSSHSLGLKGMGDTDPPPFGRSLKNLQQT